MPETEAAREGADAAELPNPSLIDAGAELVQSVVDYARQETGDLVHDKIVVPTQKAGATVALAIGVVVALLTGVLFIAAGALILLAEFIGWPAALFAVGGVLVLVAAIIGIVRTRSMQS